MTVQQILAATSATHQRARERRTAIDAKYAQMNTEQPLTDFIALCARQNAYIAEIQQIIDDENAEIAAAQSD